MDPKPPEQDELPLPPSMPPPKRCQHQASPIPCPWPSCPAGVRGKQLRLVVARDDGSRVARFFRRRMVVQGSKVVFQWTPA